MQITKHESFGWVTREEMEFLKSLPADRLPHERKRIEKLAEARKKAAKKGKR